MLDSLPPIPSSHCPPCRNAGPGPSLSRSANVAHCSHVVGNEDQGYALFTHFPQSRKTFLLKKEIADPQCLVHNQDFRSKQDLNRKRQSYHHTAGVGLQRPVNGCADLGERLYFVKTIEYFTFGQAQNQAIEDDVFPAGIFRIKAATKFQESGNAAIYLDFAARGRERASQDFEQRTLASAITRDNRDRFSASNLEVDIVKRPDLLHALSVFRPYRMQQSRSLAIKDPIAFTDITDGDGDFSQGSHPIRKHGAEAPEDRQ